MDTTNTVDTHWFHPAKRAYRYTILFFVAILTFGSYFAYDSVGAIAPTLIEKLGLDREAIGQMYTLYSVAAILSVFIGGLLIDKVGTRRASLLFSGLVTLGAAIVAFAPNVWVLYFGRFIFGWGSESLVVAQSAIFSRWFKGKELAFAFGVGLTLSRLGTLFSFNTEALDRGILRKLQLRIVGCSDFLHRVVACEFRVHRYGSQRRKGSQAH